MRIGNSTPDGYSRRSFMRVLLGSSALSVAALDRLNAGIYRELDDLLADYRQDPSPDGVFWEAVRRHYHLQDNIVMMNNGTVGPMPKPVFNTLMRAFRVQVENPYEVYSTFGARREEVRRKLAGFIGADPSEVVLTRNTTEGMNFISNGLDLEPGDEVLLSSMEHPGGLHPWRLKAARCGIVVRDVPIGLPPGSVDELMTAFRGGITDRTKVISVSHTVYISGLIFPVKELSELARERGILLLTDSAHGLGMLDLNMRELGIDFFTSSPYKWLGAPCGRGLLWVRSEMTDRVWPTIASGGWDTIQTAAKLETLSQRALPLTFALGEAIDFQERIGSDRIERRVKTLAARLKEGLRSIRGVRLHTSADPYLSAGLTAFSVEGVEPDTIVNWLREKYNIIIRTIGSERAGTRGVRVSTHIFHRDADVDTVLEGVKYLAENRA